VPDPANCGCPVFGAALESVVPEFLGLLGGLRVGLEVVLDLVGAGRDVKNDPRTPSSSGSCALTIAENISTATSVRNQSLQSFLAILPATSFPLRISLMLKLDLKNKWTGCSGNARLDGNICCARVPVVDANGRSIC
jgi:hypothetical protein